MDKHTQAISNDMAQLAEDARALMAATADVAGDKVAEARKRLGAALENGREIYGRPPVLPQRKMIPPWNRNWARLPESKPKQN